MEFVPRMAGPLTAAYFDPLGGAVGRVDRRSTPYGGRGTSYGFHIIAGWMDPAEDEAVIGWATEFSDAMAADATGSVYVNLIADDELDRIPSEELWCSRDVDPLGVLPPGSEGEENAILAFAS
jgi:hypothetical protein